MNESSTMSTPPDNPSPEPTEQPQSGSEVFAIVDNDKARFGVQMPNGDKHITDIPTRMLYALGQAISAAFQEAGQAPPESAPGLPTCCAAHANKELAGLQFCAAMLRAVIAQGGGSIPVHHQYTAMPLQNAQVLALPSFDGSGFILYLNPGPPIKPGQQPPSMPS